MEAEFLKHHHSYDKIDKIIAPSQFMKSKLDEGGYAGKTVAMQNFLTDQPDGYGLSSDEYTQIRHRGPGISCSSVVSPRKRASLPWSRLSFRPQALPLARSSSKASTEGGHLVANFSQLQLDPPHRRRRPRTPNHRNAHQICRLRSRKYALNCSATKPARISSAKSATPVSAC